MVGLRLLTTGPIALLFALLLLVKLIARSTGGYDTTEHRVLNGALLVIGVAVVASIIAL